MMRRLLDHSGSPGRRLRSAGGPNKFIHQTRGKDARW